MDFHLKAAQEHEPEVLGFLAIGAFAGSRMAETERPGVSDVDLEDSPTAEQKKAKSAWRRLVKMGRTYVPGSMFLSAPSGMSTTNDIWDYIAADSIEAADRGSRRSSSSSPQIILPAAALTILPRWKIVTGTVRGSPSRPQSDSDYHDNHYVPNPDSARRASGSG